MGRQKPNRKPRRERAGWPEEIAEFMDKRCPDCISEVTVRRFPGGPVEIKLGHDRTCPSWNAKAKAAGIDRDNANILHGIYLGHDRS